MCHVTNLTVYTEIYFIGCMTQSELLLFRNRHLQLSVSQSHSVMSQISPFTLKSILSAAWHKVNSYYFVQFWSWCCTAWWCETCFSFQFVAVNWCYIYTLALMEAPWVKICKNYHLKNKKNMYILSSITTIKYVCNYLLASLHQRFKRAVVGTNCGKALVSCSVS